MGETGMRDYLAHNDKSMRMMSAPFLSGNLSLFPFRHDLRVCLPMRIRYYNADNNATRNIRQDEIKSQEKLQQLADIQGTIITAMKLKRIYHNL